MIDVGHAVRARRLFGQTALEKRVLPIAGQRRRERREIGRAIGSVTVENAMDRVQQVLETEMGLQQMRISNRYSPGYCEWHVGGQRSLFSLLDDNRTGVTLTESCLMQPIKSVSGIIGIGTNIQKRPYGCSICHSSTCVYRRIKRN